MPAELVKTAHPLNLGRMMGKMAAPRRVMIHLMMHMWMMECGEQLPILERLDPRIELDFATRDARATHQTVPIVDRHGPSWAKPEAQPRSTPRFAE